MQDSHLLGADSSNEQEDIKNDTYSNGSDSIEHSSQLSHSFSLLSIMLYGSDYEKCETLTDHESITILKNLSPREDDELKIKEELRRFNRDKREQDHVVLMNDMLYLSNEASKQRDIRQLRAYEDIYNTLLNLNIFQGQIEEQTTSEIQKRVRFIEAFEQETFKKIAGKYPIINQKLQDAFSRESSIHLFQHLLIQLYPGLKEAKSFNHNISEHIWKYLVTSDLNIMIEKLEAK
ncbi:hypothetical protein phytr_10970 [Candidatus Phycorickettsia trachydisci]|uniref:Uncharacterized protein n=1 Tax=Candidatus Phycorickettsia trachydisci TaxID=2115978 RepID=A0A2P1P9S9_9RICK|nr:hypothetical protein [Candidatus Phycorickettsia trachydisci]AVP88023.1 hypothetical protein phytr_10970 [Candidatus Phycorickettsia trachydisci]